MPLLLFGIPAGERLKVFDPFYQIDQSSTREHGGTGLGLSIVKRLVEAHSGTVRIEPNEPRGTVFVVKLPTVAGSPANSVLPPIFQPSGRSRWKRIDMLRAVLGGAAGDHVLCGIGDDAAILAPWPCGRRPPGRPGPLVWTVDSAVEGVHFRRDLLGFEGSRLPGDDGRGERSRGDGGAPCRPAGRAGAPPKA